jgi:hypothetical protein
MSKDFFELFSKYNPMRAGEQVESPIVEHIHSFYKNASTGTNYRCKCGELLSSDEVFETNSSTSLKKLSEKEEILKLIDNMMKDPPMRGDIALSDLRRKITGEDK